MWFLEQVVIICLAQITMIPFTFTKPHTYLNNNNKGNNKYSSKNYLTSVQEAKNSDINSESILKAFNFPDIEYPVAATPRPQPYFQDFNDFKSTQRNFMSDASNIKLKTNLKYARNGTFNNLQKFSKPIKTTTTTTNSNKPKDLSDLPKEFTSSSEFRNVGNFPEVEYPLSAKDTWRPNYWSIPSVSKDLSALIIEDSDLKQNLANIYPTRNLGFSSKSGKCRSFSIKSYSDIMKNKELLKQVLENKATNISSKQNNSTSRNDFIINCEENFATNDINTLPIENTEQELHTTAIPYYFTSIDVSPDCEEFNLNISNTSVFNESNKRNNNPYMPYQNALIPNIMETDNSYKGNNALNFEEESIILLEPNGYDREDISPDYIQDIKDLYDIERPERPDTGTDFCGLDDDYTTDMYSEERDTGWFSHPVTTPTPFSSTTVDLTWKNCKIITPCEVNVDELEDYYISV